MRTKISPSLLTILLTVVLFAGSACSVEETTPATPTATALLFITATLPPTQTPLPSPTLEPATATLPVAPVEGQTSSQLNVRSAPSTDSEQLGTVDIFAKVQIVGKDPSGGWWMISYPASPTGTGWITAQFVQVPDPSGVPVINGQTQPGSPAPITEAGPTVAAGGGEVPTSAPTQVFATAYPDNDAANAPAVSITLSATSVQNFDYSSDISSPKGDPEDWVQFSLSGQTGQQKQVYVRLDCSGSSGLNVELIQNGVSLQSWNDVSCMQASQLQLYLFPGAPYTLRLSPSQGSSPINYVAYTVTVQLIK